MPENVPYNQRHAHLFKNDLEKVPTVAEPFSRELASDIQFGRYDKVFYGINNEELYAQRQSGLDQLANGLLKAAGTFTTSFLSGTVGLVNGLTEWASTGNFSSFYDNDFNRKIDDINKSMEDALPNYYTQAEKDAEWYSPTNLFTGNFLGDKVLKNLGYSAGALAGGFGWGLVLRGIGLTSRLARYGKSLQALEAVESAMANVPKAQKLSAATNALNNVWQSTKNIAGGALMNADRAIISSTGMIGEATIEALQSTNEFRNNLIEEYKGLYGANPSGNDLEEINRYADAVGNNVFAFNAALLTFSNFIQLPKILGSSRKAEKRMINEIATEGVGPTSKFITDAPSTGNVLSDFANVLGKPGRFVNKYVLGPGRLTFSVSESAEELSQYAIQTGTDSYFDRAYENSEDVNSILEGLGKVFRNITDEGLRRSLTDKEGLEGALIGGFSGALQKIKTNIKERGFSGTGGEYGKNTQLAIGALNKTKIDQVLRDGSKYAAIAIGSQNLRQQAIVNGDIVNEKDYEKDYELSYILPRVKYGKLDSIIQDVDYYQEQASTDAGFQELVDNVALPGETREKFLERISKLKDTAKAVNSLYESLSDKYSGIKIDGKEVYSSEVIDKLAYSAAKVSDYNVRIPEVGMKLMNSEVDNVNDIINDITNGKIDSFKDAVAKINDRTDLNNTDKANIIEMLEDLSEMTIRRKRFTEDYNKILENPQKYKDPVTTPEDELEGEEFKEREKVVIEGKSGKRTIYTNEQYVIGKSFNYDKDGLEIPITITGLTVLGENEDGTIKIKDNKGEVKNISKEELADYKISRFSDLDNNKTLKYFVNHRNEIFEYNFGKEYGGKKTGRLEYDGEKLFFVYKDDKGKIRRKQIDNSHFVAQEGYDKPRIQKVGDVENQEQKSAKEEFTSPEEIENQKKTLASNRDVRLEIITQIENETRERLEQVNKKLDAKKAQLDSIQKDLDKIGDEVKAPDPRTKREKALEAKYPELSRQKVKFGKVFAATSRAISKLSSMKEEVNNEIARLTAEKAELEFNLDYFADFSQNLDELPENSGEFLKELKEQVGWLKELVNDTGSQINALAKLSKKIEDAIKDFVSLLQSSMQKFDADYPDYIRDTFERIKDNPTFSDGKTLKEYLADYAMLEDLQKEISLNENQLAAAQESIAELYKQLEDLGNQYNAKKQILDRFQSVADAYLKRKKEEDQMTKNQELINSVLGTADTSVQSAEYSKEFEPAAKKADDIIPRATLGVTDGKSHQVRANTFGFNLNNFPNRKNIRGVYVTSKNEDKLIPGLTDRLRIDEAGVINEDIKKDEIIALVMVQEDEDGKLQLVGVDGQPIPEGVNPLDAAIYQVFPDANLEWGAKFNNESMFRDAKAEERQELIKSVKQQYKKWRDSVLSMTDLSEGHEIEASFGRLENVTDADGKTIFETRTSVQDANLINEDDLEATQLINIPTLPTDGKYAVESKGTVTFTVPVGTVLLETPNGLVKLQNKKHSEKEAEVIYQAILQFAKNMLDPKVGVDNPKSDRLLTWLKSVVYWGIPEDREGNRKPAGYNSIFFEKNDDGKLMLTISGKGKDFPFTPTALEENKETILLMLSNMYNNINNHAVKQLNEPYEEILSISDSGEITSRIWKNYQSYLLSNTTPDGGKRSGDQLPLSTTAKPVENKEQVNRTNIYFFTTDTADDFVIPVVEKKKPVTVKVLTPGGPTKAAPVSDIEVKKADIERRRQESLTEQSEEEWNNEKGWFISDELDGKKGYAGYYNGKEFTAKTKEELFKILNAKYNAELAALEKVKPAAEKPVSKPKYTLSNDRQIFVTPKGKKIIFIAPPNVTAENFKTTIKIFKGEDLEEVVRDLEAQGKEPGEVLKTVVFNEIKSLISEDEESIIVGDVADDEVTVGETEEITLEDEESVSIEDEETVEIPEEVVNKVESKTGKPISQSVLKALNTKISASRREALREVIKRDVKQFVPENWDQVEKWLASKFPKVPVYRVKNIIQATNGKQAWGMFKDGAIYIYENAEVGTVYHEVFHAVWRMFSDPAEQKAVLDEMRNRTGTFYDRSSMIDVKYSEATEDQLEEKLAEEFRDYVQFKKIPNKPAKGRPYILKLFADMIAAIKELFLAKGSESKVEEMFSKINKGYYKANLPFENSLSFAKKGVIDIDSVFADEDAVLSQVSGISDVERNDIIQEMTYLTLIDLIETDESLFNVEKKSKAKIYRDLKPQVLQTVGEKYQLAEELLKEYKEKGGAFDAEIKDLENIMASTLALMENIDSQWNLLVDKHQEYLKTYQIEFDENDIINLRSEDNSGRETYQDATKIDNFKKANSAVKLLLATMPEVNEDDTIIPSSIGGAKLIPISKTYISLMNNLHTSSSVEKMVKRLREMAENDPNYRTLYRRITKKDWKSKGVDFSNVTTQHGLQLISSIWNTFRKQNPDVKNVFILENGNVVVGDANLTSAAQQLRSEYINSIVFKAKEGKGGLFVYDEKEKVFKGNVDKVRNLSLSTPESTIDFLRKLGIVFTRPEINKMSTEQYKVFKSAVLGIRESISKGEKIATFSGKTLDIDKRLLQIALVKAAITNPEFSSTYFNVSGERTQTFIGTNAVSDLYNFLSKLENFNKDTVGGTRYAYLLTDSFAKNSNLLKRMFTEKGVRKDDTSELFKVGMVSGTINEEKGKRKESSKLNYKERLVQEINLNLAGQYLNLVPGDASIEWMINMGNAISMTSMNRGMDVVNEIFKGYFIDELNLAREGRPVAKGKSSKDLRFFKGILGKELSAEIIEASGTPEEVYKQFENKINQKLEEFINKDVNKLRTVLFQYGILNSSELGGMEFENIDLPKNLSDRDVNRHLTVLTVNYMIANIEMHKLLYSDPYQYEDELKRIKSFNSPRQSIINSSPKMNTAFNNVWNRTFGSNDIGYTKFTRDYFRSATHTDVIGVIDIPNYDYAGFKETDGSGIISMKANREFRIRASNWNDAEELQYKYDIAWEKRDKSEGLSDDEIVEKGLKLSKEELDILEAGNPGIQSAYTPIKPIVSGSKLDKNGLPSKYNDIVLDKFALYPLSYRIVSEIDKESNAVKLYNKMQNEDIDYVVFSSGRKVGGSNPHQTYKDGVFNEDPYVNPINVPFSIMSIQAEVPSKDNNLVTRGSQVTKLITLDFMEAGVPIDFMDDTDDFAKRYQAWYKLSDEKKLEYNNGDNLFKTMKENQDLLEALIEEGYKSTLDRLGIKETIVKDSNGNILQKKYELEDINKAGQTLREEILKREVNDNVSAALSGFLQGKVVLEATPAYQQIRNILYSIADKQFISPKINGGMKVQIPSTFYEKGVRNVKDGLYESDVLSFYTDKDGKRVAEVMLGRWFDSSLSDEELMDYFNNDPEGKKQLAILAGVGFRIPTQKQNSIDAIVIKKFLPKEFGDSVVIPAALVQKVGSDFDIDKLSVYLKNVYVKNGKPKLIPYFGIGQQAIDKFTELFNKGEFLSDEEMKELDRYISEEFLMLEDIAEQSASAKLMSSIVGKLFSEDELTQEFTRSIRSKDQIISRLYKKSLENAYIQNMENLITHPKNYSNLVKPNSAQELKDLSKFIAEKTVGSTFDYSSVENMLDRTFMSRLRHAFVTGKYAIGIAAVNQTNHSLNQRQVTYIDKSKWSVIPEEDKFWLGDGEIKFQEYNKVEVNGRMVPTLSMIKNKAGEFISDIIGMFIDGYVDISKGPWIMELGATPNVASTWLFLVKLGVPIKSVAYFMNQPIIRDYLRSIEVSGYSWLFMDNFVNDMADIYMPDMTEQELNKKLEYFKIPDVKVLEKNLGRRAADMNPNEKFQQYAILKEFLKYAKMAEHMFHVTQGSNYDTATFNDPYLVFKKQMQQIKAQKTIISSVDDLLSNSFLGRLASSVSDVRNAFSTILTSDSPKVRNVMQKVLTPFVETSDREFVKIAQKAVNDLFDWAVQTNQNLNNMIKDILVNDGGVGREVVEFVQSIKSQGSEHPLYDNEVINVIQSIPSIRAAVGGPNNVKLNLGDNKVYNQNNVIYGFRQLRDYLEGEKNPLYDRIVTLAILQSGLSSSPISFTSLLPYEDFENIYNQTLSKLEGLSNLEDFYKLGVFQRNNWNNNDLVPYLKAALITSKTGNMHYNPSMKFLPDPVKEEIANKNIPPILTRSKFNREANSDYIVYTWEKQEDLLTKQELDKAMLERNVYKVIAAKKAAMRKAGDYSFINKGLFRKVYDNYGVPFEHTAYDGKKYFVYKAINAWGDSFRANEFWATDHKSVLKNGFIEVEDVDNNVIISSFLNDKKVKTKPTASRTITADVKAEYPGKPEFNKLPGKSTTQTMTYAGIGSRQTPPAVLKQMTEVARELERKGYTLNTGVTFRGNKEGADKAFDDGATKKNLFSPENQGSRPREQAIAKEIHPNPNALSPGALKLMARNTNQVFGDNLNKPVDFVLFYAKETSGIRPEGGTGQAVEMARLKGIPTINMADPNWKSQLNSVLSKEEKDPFTC